MNQQNFENHARLVKGFHFVLGTFLIIGTICAAINIFIQIAAKGPIFDPILIDVLFICVLLSSWYTRVFSLKAQDRAIRAEESLRYFILTQKEIDNRITMGQIIALRFAPDDEVVALMERAIKENLSPNEIKKAIKNWKADYHRV
jgi:hypothetical protein